MADHPNAARARGLWDAMLRGDTATVMAAFDDDIVWHEIGRAEPRRGTAELAAVFAQSDFEISPTLIDMVASDDHVAAIIEAVATRAGRTLHYRVAEIHTLRDGRIVERWAYSDDTQAIADFFA
jgi:ketosteroid isomerase-like protein